jgi:hypothetical protein
MSLTASVSPLIALGGACRRRHRHHNAPPAGEPQEPVPLAQPTDDRPVWPGEIRETWAGSVAGSVRIGLVGR